jgi:hypothetical protein
MKTRLIRRCLMVSLGLVAAGPALAAPPRNGQLPPDKLAVLDVPRMILESLHVDPMVS